MRQLPPEAFTDDGCKLRGVGIIRIIDGVTWTDIRPVRLFGSCSLVWRGQRHFLNAGVSVSTQETLPMGFKP